MIKFNKFNKMIYTLLIVNIVFFSRGYFDLIEAATTMPTVSSHAYVIMDANSGNILYSLDKDKKIYPASTVKLLTALVAIENCDLSKKMTVEKEILDEIPYGAYVLDLQEGSTYTLEELLNMLLISSSADAADTIAVGVAGSKEKFAIMMNERAKTLGLENSSFDNAIGRDGKQFPNTYSTANDIAKLTRYAMTVPLIRDIVSKVEYEIKNYDGEFSKVIYNTNRFLRGQEYERDLYKVIGGKTGSTLLCGHSLATTARSNDNAEVICAFFGDYGRNNMYLDIEKLLTATFENYYNGEINLEKGYIDTRYLKSRKIINKYLEEGILEIDQSLNFNPKEVVTKKEFITMTNKILDTSYKESNSKEDMTILDIAKLFSNIKEKDYSIWTKIKYKIKLSVSKDQFNNMLHLYELNVLPKDYSYDEKSTITREEMIIILDNLSKQL